MNRVEVKTFAPRAFETICDLSSGEEHIAGDLHWGDGFIINFNVGADQDWQEPSAEAPGWHKDGDWFRHFLDSPEQALLYLVVWRDIEPQSGGTFFAPDSVRPSAVNCSPTRRAYTIPTPSASWYKTARIFAK